SARTSMAGAAAAPVNFTALPTRFRTTCSSCVRIPHTVTGSPRVTAMPRSRMASANSSRVASRTWDSGTARGLLLVEEVQRRAHPEPLELRRGVRVLERERLRRAVAVLHQARDGFARREAGQAHQADPVVLADPVVVRRVLEREGQQALLLQIRLVDARER